MRIRPASALAPLLVLALALAVGPASAAQDAQSGTTSPPGGHPGIAPSVIPPLPALGPGAVDALTVRSWGGCRGGGVRDLAWDAINEGWAELGDQEVHIDYSYPPVCRRDATVTYEALVARGADVLILSDTAGGLNQLTPAEIDAIEQYVADGHGLIATYLLRYGATDNSALAPALGIDTPLTAGSQTFRGPYRMRVPDHPLFAQIPSGFYPTGYSRGQSLLDELWERPDRVDSAVFVAKAQKHAAILVQEGPPARTVYVSSMPEYNSNQDDKQFLYNAITWVDLSESSAAEARSVLKGHGPPSR